VPKLIENQNAPLASSVDFGPAVKAAQRRAPSPSLIMESAVTMAWRGAEHRMLVGPRSVYAEEGVVITRFHAFLKPHEMKDVTFMPAERGLFNGNFFIDLTDPRYRESTQRASATLMMLGLATAATSRGSRYAKGNLQKLALILLLLGLVLA
jgi:hypothetical protein